MSTDPFNGKADAAQPRPQYNTDAESELLALSGQPRILDMDKPWEQDIWSVNSENLRVQDLVVTMIYYTHGVEGIREFQVEREAMRDRFLYEIQMHENLQLGSGAKRIIRVQRGKDTVRIWNSQKWVELPTANNHCEMRMEYSVQQDGAWKAKQCEAGSFIRSSSRPDHLEKVSAFMVVGLATMIINFRRKDTGRVEEKYAATLA